MTMFPIYADPGHAWMLVSKKQAKYAGLTNTDFSEYSYQRGDCFYLEEDADAPKFLGAWKAKGKTAGFIEYSGTEHSRIRGYSRIK